MGQILSFLCKWFYPKSKNGDAIADDHLADYQAISPTVINQQEHHCIDIPDYVHPSWCWSSTDTAIFESHDTNLDLTTPLIVEEVAKWKRKNKNKGKQVSDHALDNAITRVLEKKVTKKNNEKEVIDHSHDKEEVKNVLDKVVITQVPEKRVIIYKEKTKKNGKQVIDDGHDKEEVSKSIKGKEILDDGHDKVIITEVLEKKVGKKRRKNMGIQVVDHKVKTKNIHDKQEVTKKTKKKKGEQVLVQGHDKVSIKEVLEKVTTAINHVPSVSRYIALKKIGLYNSGQRILLVGEGDFSFSASLAVAFGASAVNITATSLNSEEFLTQNYGKFLNNKAKLEKHGGVVLHNVDATNMAKHPLLSIMLLFDRIIFNFPHAGKFGHSDSELRKHKDLVRGFLRNAKKMIKKDGEIHITSKSNGFYLNWDIPKIGSDQGLQLIQEVKFEQRNYLGYSTKYGFGGDKNFDCNPSKTYMFGLSQNSTMLVY